jgi:farnesyl-diphosphate farnesyltransferase
MAAQDLLTGLLKDVSRSFYLTLRVLPGAIRPQIGLAYLLARATDTIADTAIVPVEERLAALAHLRDRILCQTRSPLALDRFLGAGQPGPATSGERELLSRIEEALRMLELLSPPDQARLRETLSIIASGQELDLRRFELPQASRAAPGSAGILALQTEADLDDYTYRVAGCVGEFWTRMCRAHLFPDAALDDQFLLTNGVRFGQGLQLVNVLRDLPEDLRLGRCYLPAAQLATLDLTPADLLSPASDSRLRPVYDGWVCRAEEHLAAGWAYTNRLPKGCWRVRQACAWPILIGVRTLALLKQRNPLDSAQRLKISHADVRATLLRSVALSPFPSSWSSLFDTARKAKLSG